MTDEKDSGLTAHNTFKDTDVPIPQYIVDRTEALLSEHPPTNQRVVLDTARWWLFNVGNCEIYRWCIHYLDTLEHDVLQQTDIYHDAKNQAEDIGMEL